MSKRRASLASQLIRERRSSRRRSSLGIEQLELRHLMASEIGISPIAPIHGDPNYRGPSQTFPLDQTFELSSRPSATKTIYLDFDGHTVSGTPWNDSNNGQDFTLTAYNVEGDDSFTDLEKGNIQDIWLRVVEDFSPFDVNVTTKEPPVSDLINSGGSDDRWGARVIIGSTYEPYASAGGVAYLGSFNWDTDTPALVFENNLANGFPKYVAEATSHEVGHTLNLRHDGRSQPSEEYYQGHGNGATSWGPIMGVGYSVEVVQWSDGGYLNSSNKEDDLTIITTQNGFDFRVDDYANNTAGAGDIAGTGVVQISVDQLGVIERRTDVDVFRLSASDGEINLVIRGAQVSPNLDVKAELLNSAGMVIATSDPIDSLSANIQLTVLAGTYYLRIDGVGWGDPMGGPTGYSDYASLGQYHVTGVFESGIPPEITVDVGTLSYRENDPLTSVSPGLTVVDTVRNSYARAKLFASVSQGGTASDLLGVISRGNGTGQIGVSGTEVRYGGVLIGNIVRSNTNLEIDLLAECTTEALQALMRSIGYANSSDGPNTAMRRIEMGLGNAFKSVTVDRAVQVVAVNDSPVLANTSFAIDEDVTVPGGKSIGSLLNSSFTDPDPDASLIGVAVVANPRNVAQGEWFFSSNFGVSWAPIGEVNDINSSLVLSMSDWIGFKPVADYYGTATPLLIRGLDNTYTGSFSRSMQNVRVFLSNNARAINGPVSESPSSLGLMITGINDAPRPTVPTYSINGTQDALLDVVLPSTLFNDIDSPSITWLLREGASALPGWLSFNPTTRRLAGTPRNDDVGVASLRIAALDGDGAEGVLPLNINIANVNDTPTSFRLITPQILENQAGAIVSAIVVNDPDVNDTFTWTLSDPRFRVINGQLALREGVALNYEEETNITLQATVVDSGVPALSLTLPLTVTVIDENEFFPGLESQVIEVPHGTTSHTLIKKLTAPDGDSRQKVTMRLKSGDVGSFVLDALTGELRFRDGIVANRTQKAEHVVIVEAADDGTPSRQRSVQIKVQVQRQNLSSPVVANQSLSIGEKALANDALGKVQATDGDDDGIGLYSITDTEMWNLFYMEPTTGVVRLRQSGVLDFEARSSFVVPVRVTDTGVPARTGDGLLTITVKDQNDPPTSIALSKNVIATRRSGYELGVPSVGDQDLAASYRFSTTDSRFEFRSGKLALKSDQFFSPSLANSSFQILVRVTDNADAASFADLPLTLQVGADASPWQNASSPWNVNRDNAISPLDSLLVLNTLNLFGSRALSVNRSSADSTLPDYDVNGDGFVSPIDGLLILNYLNLNGTVTLEGEGEGERGVQATPKLLALASDANQGWLGAFHQWEDEWTSRRRSRR